MKLTTKAFAGVLVASALLTLSAFAQTTDTIVFGNTTSETSHSLNTYFIPTTDITKVAWHNTPAPSDPSATGPSDVVAGAQGLSARRLLPRTPNGDVYGGQMDFVMNVDPVKQNYFTVKMYASDPNGGNFILLNCNGREVGIRHGGGGLQGDSFFYGAGQDWWKNRFFYRTDPLPLSMTRGKTTVTLTIRAAGPIYTYAPIFTYVPEYQSIMKGPSLGFYTGYTHTGAFMDATGETQGTAPAVMTPRTLETETAALNKVTTGVNNQIAGLLAIASDSNQDHASFLASCYDAKTNYGASWITYPTGKVDADLGTQIIATLDNVVTSYAAGSGVEGSDWGGGLGSMGDAIRVGWPLISSSMSATVNYGGTLGSTTRQAAWAKALRASVDAGRYGRQTIANQAMYNGTNIYRANRGLLLVDSTKALNESEALRYLKEASGIQPWLGNDQATGGSDGTGGGPTPTKGIAPYGPNWYMCTTKGTTKDGEGFVGGDYGEVGPWMYRMGLISGDAQLQARGLTMTRARRFFRYPGADGDGYLIMLAPDPIGERNNNLPGHVDYLGSSNADDFLMASQGASVIGNDLLGAFQQEINEGQIYRYFNYLDPYLPTRWAAIKAMAATNVKLPMTAGQPDAAWADEENMVVAAKHGEELFYTNMFWRQPPFITGQAKVFVLTPSYARLGEVMLDDLRFRSTGKSIMTGFQVDTFATPADKPQEAYGGLPMATAFRSDLASVPATNRDAGRGTGYTMRYGHWLVGLNADYSANYTVKLPSNFTSATDLISGQVMSGPVVLAPKTSVVFYLPDTADVTPAPSRSLYLNAIGTNGAVTLNWADTGAANTYNVLRSTTSGSGYTTIASGVTATKYTDTAVANGTTYYYVVTATNSIGTSGYSPEASASPVASETAGLPAPWTNVDEGVSTGGSATLSSGTFTVMSNQGTYGGTTEGFQLVYQPVSGDGTFTARVQSQTASNGNGRAGLVLRSNLAQNATMASMTLRAGNHADFNYCGGDGGNITGTTYGSTTTAPYWVRLVRSGVTVTGFISPDGATWTQVGSYSFSSLPYNCYVGLLVNSGSNTAGQTNTSVFTDVNFPLGATAAPAAPTAVVKTATSATSVSLSWAQTSGAASYNVKRGTSASGPFTTVATGVAPTSYTNYGLNSGSTYYYVVSATNAAGESADSASVAATLGAPPGPLTNLSATVSSGQVALTWNSVAGAASYTVTRATSGGTPVIIASGLTAASYTDATVTDGTSYTYGAYAVNSYGRSGQGGSVSVMPPGFNGTSLTTQDVGTPQPGAASYASSTGTYTLIGSGNITSATVDGFRYAFSAVTGDCIVTTRVTSLTNNSGTDSAGLMVRQSLDPSSAYYYEVMSPGYSVKGQFRATANGGTSYQGATSGLTLPYWERLQRSGNTLTAFRSPDGVAWTNIGGATIAMDATVLIGLAATSNSGSILTTATYDNYSVLANTATGGTATASTQSTGVEASKAFDGNTGTKWYNNQLGGTGWLQYQFASGVTKVVNRYELTSANDVQQRDPRDWQFQGSNDGTNWVTLDTRTGQVFTARYQTNSYTIPGNTTAYAYHRLNITANSGGSGYGLQLSELSFLAAAATSGAVPEQPAIPSAVWSNGRIDLAWPATLRATSYNLKRATTSGGPYTNIAANLTAASYSDTGLTSGTTYYYVITALNSAGESVPSDENSATPIAPPAVPAGLTATPGNAQTTLAWTAVSGAASYNVKRATASGGPYVLVGASATPGYTDSGLANGTKYYYVVSAVNLAAESANSAQVTATPRGGTASASAGATGAQAAQAFDGANGTKWYNGVSGGTGWLQYQFLNGSKVVNAYVITSANDVPQRDPAAWQLLGSNDGATWTTLDTRTAQTFSARYQPKLYTTTNTTAYTYYRLNVTANAGGSGYGVQMSEMQFIFGLPSPWSTADIGTVGATGAAGADTGIYTVVGSGADINSTADEFRYVYQTATGDCDIAARVNGFNSQTSTARAGVMIRESLNANSTEASVTLQLNGSAAFRTRATTGATTTSTSVTGLSTPYWVRVKRVGSVFTAYSSPDGSAWTQIGSPTTITMASTVYIGLPATSVNDGALSVFTIDSATANP